jgi:uncharacterized membrane protein
MTLFRRADIFLEQLRSGVWALPTAMMLLGAVLFRVCRLVDARRPDPALLQTLWLHSGSGADAANLLATLVSAMITMVSLVFSITVVALSLAASQFGSRLVRSYVRDFRTKLTLGMFAMTILYCMLGLKVVGAEMPAESVPHVTVSVGMLLALLCVFAMLLFLHMVAQAIVADEVIRRVGADLEESIASLPTMRAGASPPRDAGQLRLPPTRLPLLAGAEGYVEAIRYHALLGHAARQDAFVNLHVMAGDFVAKGDLIGTYARAGGADADFERHVADAVLIGPERTPVQDLAFSLRHLMDVGMRSLSAAINDDNTALVVIDRLRGALARLLRKELPDGRHVDDAGVLRVVGPHHTHEHHIHHALHALRTSASRSPVVVITLVEALAKLMPHAPDARLRRFLLDQAELAAQAGLTANEEVFEQAAITRAIERAREAHEAFAAAADSPSAVKEPQ